MRTTHSLWTLTAARVLLVQDGTLEQAKLLHAPTRSMLQASSGSIQRAAMTITVTNAMIPCIRSRPLTLLLAASAGQPPLPATLRSKSAGEHISLAAILALTSQTYGPHPMRVLSYNPRILPKKPLICRF